MMQAQVPCRRGVSLSPTTTSARAAICAGLRYKACITIKTVLAYGVKDSAVLAGSVVDDKSVPEAHKGLHDFLYGDGGSEKHEQERAYAARTGEDEGTVVMPVSAYLESRDGEKPLGIYCVYDQHLRPQYIGYSRNVALAIKGHLARVGPDQCSHVRAMVYGNKAMASRANLERGVHNWIHELLGGQVPPGNADPQVRAAWEGTTVGDPSLLDPASGPAGDGSSMASPAVLDKRLMSPAELAAYEEKRLKLRKAMGEKMVQGPGGASGVSGGDHHHEDEEVEDDPATRRQKLMNAMNRGDWSAVIHAQTQETLGAADSSQSSSEGAAAASTGTVSDACADSSSGGGEASSSSTAGVVSPFQKDAEGGAAAAAAAARTSGAIRASPPLTVEAVQAALEEVRPYLMADGGDVEVVDVTAGVVYLRLQGACSSCPSQSATMKGGIERVIKQTFGDQVRDILQLDKADPAANVERVDAALNMLRGAIYNFGGFVEVLSVQDGVCTIRYKGPPAIGKGVQGAIKDTFADLKEVRLVD